MRVELARVTAPTSTGTFDITFAGGGTCIGAVLWMNKATADNTAVAHAHFGIGATDGTRQGTCSFWSQDAQLSTNTATRGMTDQAICLLLNSTTIDGEAAFDSFITDGVRLNCGNAWNAAYFITARLYFSDNVNDKFYTGTFDTVAGNVDVTAPGFEPKVVEVFSTRASIADTAVNGAGYSHGFAIDGILATPTQFSVNWGEGDNAADGVPRCILERDVVARNTNGLTLLGAVQIDDFDASGFTAFQINSAGFPCFYVAIACDNECSIDLYTTKTSTGAQSYTGAGFHPQSVFGFMTWMDTLDTADNTDKSGSLGLFAFTVTDEFCASIQVEDAAATTNTQDIADSTAINLPNDDRASSIVAAITDTLSTGFELTYSATDGTARYFGGVSIELLNLVIGPDAGSASFLGVSPTVVVGSISITPAAASVSFLGVNPTTIQGSLTLNVEEASVSFLGVDPTVFDDEEIIKATMTAHETRSGFNFLFGTLPVPDNWVETDLALRDPDTGDLLPTDYEVVAYGPTGNPTVLEIRSYFENTDGANPKTFDVEEATVTSGLSFGANIRIDIRADAPNSSADHTVVQFSSRLLQAAASAAPAGAVAYTERRAGELQASSGSRLFGYEAFITTVAGEPDVWLVEMTVHNGNVGTTGSPLGANALHDLFFNEIRLVPFDTGTGLASSDYLIKFLHPTPYSVNATQKLMAPNGDGSDHCIQQGQAHEYRFAIYHTSKLARATILLEMRGFMVADFSKTKWSWSNRNTAHFGPAGTLVAEFNISGHLPYGQDWEAIRLALLNGNPVTTDWGASTPAGPYHLRGPTDASSTGGSGIYGHMGHEVVSATGTRLNRLNTLIAIHGMDRDRQASKSGLVNGNLLRGVCLVDNDQSPIDPAQWNLSDVKAVYPGEFEAPGKVGPFSRYLADDWRLDLATTESSLPFYYGTITAYGPVNFSHIIRAIQAALPLIWLRNDRLAKSYIAQFAAWARIRSNEYDEGDLYAQWIDGLDDNSNPGKGLGGWGGRYGGWPILVLAADYKLSSTSKRTNYIPWYEQNNDAHERGQLASGSWHAAGSGETPENNLDHQWTVENGHPPGYEGGIDAAASQAIEIGIHGYGMLAWRDALGSATLQTLLNDSCRGLWEYHWMPGAGAPHFVSPVRPESSKFLPAWTTRYPGTGDPNGTLGGIAPDCFTKPPYQFPDNYQIAPLILAGLRGDPADENAWNAIYDVLGVSTVEDALVELQDMATAQEDKFCAGWNAVMAFLQDVLDNTFVIPVAGSVQFLGVAPDLFFNSTTASPAAGSASFLGVNPTVFVGGRIGPLDPAVFTALGVSPTVVVGSISITPAAAVVSMLGVDPALAFSSTTATPAAGSASFLGVNPTVTLGSRTAGTDPAIAEFLANNPTVIVGSLALTPAAAPVSFEGEDPEVVYLSFTYTPAAGVVSFLAEDPLIGNSLVFAPDPALATFLAADPAVVDYYLTLGSSPVSLSGNITSVYATLRGRL